MRSAALSAAKLVATTTSSLPGVGSGRSSTRMTSLPPAPVKTTALIAAASQNGALSERVRVTELDRAPSDERPELCVDIRIERRLLVALEGRTPRFARSVGLREASVSLPPLEVLRRCDRRP